MSNPIVNILRKSDNPVVSSVYNFARQSFYGEWDRNGDWKFVSLSDYAGMVSEWIRELPKDFDIVCAIPRSGLIAGSMIATTLGKPLTTPDLLLAGTVWEAHNQIANPVIKTVLLVDDSIGTGASMVDCSKRIQANYPDIKIIWAALFVRNESRDKIDCCHIRHSDNMRLSFEFNLSRLATSYGRIAMDMDGVICRDYVDPLPDERYVGWITEVDPYLIPKGCVDAIITNRSECHRKITEDWLREHEVEYKSLIMNDGGSNALQFKTDTLMKLKPAWFWESDPLLSEAIYKATRIPVLCTNTGRFFGGV